MRLRSTMLAIGFLLAAGGTGAVLPGVLRHSSSLHERAQQVVGDERPFEARLSGSTRWRQCAPVDSLSVRCKGYAPSRAGRREALRIANAARRASTSDAAWALATIGLVAGDTGVLVATELDSLERLAQLEGDSANLRNDLAVAYLARGGAENLFLSLEQIERAYAIDSASAVIAFNRALILTRLHLSREARAAWETFLRRHPSDGWTTEASVRLREVETRSRTQRFDHRAETLAAETERDPQQARELVIDSLLTKWAISQVQGERAMADSACTLTAAIGNQLARRSGDRTVNNIVDVCRAGRSAVARAWLEFTNGARLFRRGEFGEADPILRDAAAKLRSSAASPLAAWAEVSLGFVDIYEARYSAANVLFTRVEHEARARGDSALRARALWGLGLSAIRLGGVAEAIDHYERAANIYHHLGESLNEGAILSQAGDGLSLLGRDEASLEHKYRALALLDGRVDSRSISGRVVAIGLVLSDFGLPAAAASVQREAVRVAATSDRPADLPEALIQLASVEQTLGQSHSGRAHLSRARALLALVKDSSMIQRQQMSLSLALAAFDSLAAPDSAIDRLTEVERYFTAMQLQYNLALPLVRRGRLLWRQGDLARAKRDVEAAADAVERQTIDVSDPSAMRERATARREVFETLVALSLETGDTVGAFLASERARGNSLERIPAISPKRTVVSYFSLSNSTILWILSAAGPRTAVVPVSATHLRERVERAEALVRRGEESVEWHALSRELFDLLLKPASQELETTNELVIVTDGALGRLPFSALRDSAGRYLIERVVPVYAAKVRPEKRVAVRTSSQSVIVGYPSLDAQLFPDLRDLPGTLAEVDAVRQLRPGARVITGDAATRGSVIRSLPTATMFHFAGHARLVPGAPSLSHLVLAKSDTGGLGANVLSAADIAVLDLHRLDLAILSACGTQQARSNRDGGQSGLSQAFFAAGAKAVISSRWEADDAGTADLMRLFYSALERGDRPARALAHAQLELRKSAGARRSMRVWAAFMYEEA